MVDTGGQIPFARDVKQRNSTPWALEPKNSYSTARSLTRLVCNGKQGDEKVQLGGAADAALQLV